MEKEQTKYRISKNTPSLIEHDDYNGFVAQVFERNAGSSPETLKECWDNTNLLVDALNTYLKSGTSPSQLQQEILLAKSCNESLAWENKELKERLEKSKAV